MMCPKCGKLIEGGAVRCPDCGTEFDLQYAPPRLEPGPSQLQQTQPTVIPKNVPVGKAKHSPHAVSRLTRRRGLRYNLKND